MARYIDADKLKELVNGRSSHWLNEWDTLGVLAVIDETPTADVAEVKHGKWECVNNDKNVWMCDGDDGCGTTIQIIEGTPTDNCFDFCPACGAKMDSWEESKR